MQFKIQPVDAQECERCGIRAKSLFADLNSDDFHLIEQSIYETSVPAHATLFDEGTPGHFLYTLRRGLIKLVRYQSDGTQRIIRMLAPGDIAGLETTVHPVYDSTAIALTEVAVCRIPLTAIQQLESASPRLHAQMLRKWHEALKQADDFIADLASGSARQRLARLLLRLAQGDPGQQILLASREDVGAMLGITTETASRTVASFRREGLLLAADRQGRQFRIDAARLAAVAARND